jgi:NAD(P)-dependent dehydrogenase (short-subunit alcohol dehydrogenase family)
MGTYAVTGSASGIGRAVADKLRAAGHTVIGVDLRDAEVTADLSTAHGRCDAAAAVLHAARHRLDGAVLAAGIGPAPGDDRPRLIMQTNYYGVVDLLTAWQPALAAARHAKVVVVSSNSTTTIPMVPRRAVRALMVDDPAEAIRAVRWFRSAAPAMAYAASKLAVSRWVRREAVTAQWAGHGIRLNALAPGAIMTPLLQEQLTTPREAEAIHRFPIPVGGFGDPDHVAEWMLFMLSDAAEFLCGAVIFLDGGSDAYFRSDHWPSPLSVLGTPRYLLRARNFRAVT